MPLYEHVFLARQDLSAQQAESMMQDLKKLIEDGGGAVRKTEYWGLRPIAYRIKKNRKAHYALMNLDAPPAAVTELERQIRLNADILRYMTVRVDELEETPSPMMRRSDRDDRDGRGRGDRGDRGERSERGRGSRDRDRDAVADDDGGSDSEDEESSE
jgi:small subunit ribosomal protein S6